MFPEGFYEPFRQPRFPQAFAEVMAMGIPLREGSRELSLQYFEHMRVGVETARFGMPEVKFGIPSGMEACLLPGLIGWGKTRELVFTGELIDAREAYHCGFLDKLVTAIERVAAFLG